MCNIHSVSPQTQYRVGTDWVHIQAHGVLGDHSGGGVESLALYRGAGTRYWSRGRCAALREGSREGRETEGWGRGQLGSSTDPLFQVFSLFLQWGNHRMVVLFGRV